MTRIPGLFSPFYIVFTPVSGLVAMTANVFREDIERCLEAGMNGHVGKPLDFDEVLSQLKRYLC